MGIEPKVMQEATYRMWLSELNAMGDKGRPDWRKRRIAAEQICNMVGVTDLIRAISLDGELRPAPMWPEVDIVPVGGGPNALTCEVRTYVKAPAGKGGKKFTVKIGLYRNGRKFDKEQISEALERGRFELKKMIEMP